MDKTFFTHKEAKIKLRNSVEALYDFPSVPKGSIGTVTKVKLFSDKKWIVCVKWNIPRSSHLIMSQFGELSFNFLKKSKAVTDDFCKSEYYQLLKEI